MIVVFDPTTRRIQSTVSHLGAETAAVYAGLKLSGKIAAYYEGPLVDLNPVTAYVAGEEGSYSLATMTIQSLGVTPPPHSVGGTATISGFAADTTVSVDGGDFAPVESDPLTLTLEEAGTYRLVFRAPRTLDTTVEVTAS